MFLYLIVSNHAPLYHQCWNPSVNHSPHIIYGKQAELSSPSAAPLRLTCLSSAQLNAQLTVESWAKPWGSDDEGLLGVLMKL